MSRWFRDKRELKKEFKKDIPEIIDDWKQEIDDLCDESDKFLDDFPEVERNIKKIFKTSIEKLCANKEKYFKKISKRIKTSTKVKRTNLSWKFRINHTIINDAPDELNKHKEYFNRIVVPTLKISKFVEGDLLKLD